MNWKFNQIVNQILQTDSFYIELLEDLLAESGYSVKVELHVTRHENTIVIREQLAQASPSELEMYSE